MGLFSTKKKQVPAGVDNSKNEDLELLRKDKFGNKYYVYKQGRQMPAERYLIGLTAVEQANMNVDTNSLLAILDEAVSLHNQNKFAESIYCIQTLRNRVHSADPFVAYLSLAGVYVLINNEDPKKYNVLEARRKYKIWSNDSELKAFFLDFASNTIKSWQPNYKATTQDVSPEVAPKEEPKVKGKYSTLPTS